MVHFRTARKSWPPGTENHHCGGLELAEVSKLIVALFNTDQTHWFFTELLNSSSAEELSYVVLTTLRTVSPQFNSHRSHLPPSPALSSALSSAATHLRQSAKTLGGHGGKAVIPPKLQQNLVQFQGGIWGGCVMMGKENQPDYSWKNCMEVRGVLDKYCLGNFYL